MIISRGLYDWYAGFAPYLVAWTAVFTAVTSVRIVLQRRAAAERTRPSVAFTELAALPLAALQSVCFVKAARAGDIASLSLFLWWGPGFIASAAYYVHCKRRKVQANWYPFRIVISWLCKLNYLAFMAIFHHLGHHSLMFVYSAWIMNDQFGLAYLSLDADRLRRTFDDYWLVRLLYPLGLLLPWAHPEIPFAEFYRVYGILLLGLWLSGIAYVRRKGRLTGPPEFRTLLRNMVYMPKPDAAP